MLEILVVLMLVAGVFAIGYFATRDKTLPVTDTPVEVIEADLLEAGVILAQAETAVAAAAEQVKPKRTRKPRTTTAAKSGSSRTHEQ